jgi:metal-responsive CopG/Arc/MetJ family transcriptional regulator
MEDNFKNLHLQLSTEDIRKIDEWKIAHGMKSRTEAIRAMIRIATNGSYDNLRAINLANMIIINI